MSDYIKREYDDLVKRLRNAAQWAYKGLVTPSICLEAADAIEELSKPRWISVAERLPEMYQPVLTFDGEFYAVEMRVPYILTEDGEQIESDWWVEADNDINAEYYRGLRDGAVDYWMPLTEPPKEVDT